MNELSLVSVCGGCATTVLSEIEKWPTSGRIHWYEHDSTMVV